MNTGNNNRQKLVIKKWEISAPPRLLDPLLALDPVQLHHQTDQRTTRPWCYTPNYTVHDMKSPRNSLNFSSKIYGAPFERMLPYFGSKCLITGVDLYWIAQPC